MRDDSQSSDFAAAACFILCFVIVILSAISALDREAVIAEKQIAAHVAQMEQRP
jgi:hypothetical protein